MSNSYVPVKSTIEAYRKEKLHVLEDFCIEITSEIEREINSREREIDIDHYCHDLIKKFLEEDEEY